MKQTTGGKRRFYFYVLYLFSKLLLTDGGNQEPYCEVLYGCAVK